MVNNPLNCTDGRPEPAGQTPTAIGTPTGGRRLGTDASRSFGGGHLAWARNRRHVTQRTRIPKQALSSFPQSSLGSPRRPPRQGESPVRCRLFSIICLMRVSSRVAQCQSWPALSVFPASTVSKILAISVSYLHLLSSQIRPGAGRAAASRIVRRVGIGRAICSARDRDRRTVAGFAPYTKER